MDLSTSAGGIVVNARGEIVLVQERGLTWSLPRGGVESGETPLAAARRDVEEETGLSDLHYEGSLPAYERADVVDEAAHIYPFLFTTGSLDLAPRDAAVVRAGWVTVDEGIPLLPHLADRALVDAARDRIAALASRLREAVEPVGPDLS